MKLKAIAFLFGAYLGLAGSAAAQNPSNLLTECLEQNAISTAKTPFDLWRSIPTCVGEDKYEQAILMYGLAGSLGIYDSMRVKDKSAYQAAKILPMAGMAAMGKERSQVFQQKAAEYVSDIARRTKLCEIYKAMSPPRYFPSYMVNHGLASLSGSKTDPLVPDINEAESWPKAVDAYVQCPKG